MSPCRIWGWSYGTSKNQSPPPEAKLRSFRWGGRTGSEKGKKSSQQLVDLNMKMLTSQVPNITCFLSHFFHVSSQMSRHQRATHNTLKRTAPSYFQPFLLTLLLFPHSNYKLQQVIHVFVFVLPTSSPQNVRP